MRKAFMVAAAALAALAIAEIALIAGSSHAADASNYVPPLATIAGTVEDIRTVSDASDNFGSSAYIEIKIADADANGAAAVQAEKDGSSLPEAGDTLMLIRNDHTDRTYGPEPEIGDEVEAKIWYYKEDVVIDGRQRAAYDICSIETYSWLIESGQRSRYPEVR
ncbi:MAG: hypothetical protein ACI361_05025 [Atopobiaceae bacterium]